MANKIVEQGYKNYRDGDLISDEQLSLIINSINKTLESLSDRNDRRFDLLENKFRSYLYSLENMVKARKKNKNPS